MFDQVIIKNIISKVLESELRDDLRFRFPTEDYDRIFVPELLTKVLQEIPYLKENSGRQINYGFTNVTFDVRVVGEAIVSIALDSGIESAVNAFVDFLSQDYCSSIDVILLSGLSVEEKFELQDGVFLAPLEDVPSDSLQQFLKDYEKSPRPPSTWAKTYHGDHLEPPVLASAALFRVTETRPKFFDQNRSNWANYFTKDPNLINDIAGLLVLVGPSSPNNLRRYHDLASGSLLSGFSGRISRAPAEGTRVFSTHLATTCELVKFKSTLSNYLSLNSKRKKALAVPLHRLNQAVRHKNLTDRAIDLGIALESLLLYGSNVPQLSLTFRLRGAWLLGKDLEDRQRISSLLKDLYTARSNSVHSGDVDPRNELKDIDATLIAGLTICAEAIEAVIEKKTLHWESMVLGGE